MFIKIYIHPDKLSNLQNSKEPVLVRQMTMSQYDIEVFINTKKYKIINQSNGLLISKKTLFERIFKKGN